MPLTGARIRSPKSDAKPDKASDFDGQFLSIKPPGSKLWQFMHRVGGREKLLAFGMYPAVSLLQARSARDEARAELAAGEDPGEARQELKRQDRDRRGHTFASQAEAVLVKAIKEGRAPATQARTEWLLAMANADFGSAMPSGSK